MSDCLQEGGLRAYLDRELPPEEMAAAALHLAACAECHNAYNQTAARSARVAAWMTALDAPPLPAPKLTPSRRWRALPAAALALAAVLAFAFFVAPKRREAAKPAVVPHAAQAGNPVRVATTAVESAPAIAGAAITVAHTRARSRRPAGQAASKVDYYLALDDQPIETGYIMRLDIGDRQADVIFDGDGNPRAIHPVIAK